MIDSALQGILDITFNYSNCNCLQSSEAQSRGPVCLDVSLLEALSAATIQNTCAQLVARNAALDFTSPCRHPTRNMCEDGAGQAAAHGPCLRGGGFI